MGKADIPVLYEDAACFVVNKPAGIAVHPAPTMNERTLIEILEEERQCPLFLVHRIDRGTTGCLLIAKTKEHCEALQEQFKDRTISKQYLALCAGIPEQKQAAIDAPIGRNLINRTKMSLFRTSTSRNARTLYTVLAQTEDCALLRCDIETGRTHQIRVHLSAIGHPILGDEKYASGASKSLAKQYGVTCPLLHAHILQFTSPTGEQVYITAPLPDTLQHVMDTMGLTL